MVFIPVPLLSHGVPSFLLGRKLGDSPWVFFRVWQKAWGQSLGVFPCLAMNLLAECPEQQVASRTRSTALRVRFIVGDRESLGTVPGCFSVFCYEFAC
jgi:hypothetical protein